MATDRVNDINSKLLSISPPGDRWLLFGKNRIAAFNKYLEKFYQQRLRILKIKPMPTRFSHRQMRYFPMGSMPLAPIHANHRNMLPLKSGTRQKEFGRANNHLSKVITGIDQSTMPADRRETAPSQAKYVSKKPENGSLLPPTVLRIFSRYLGQNLPSVRIHKSEAIDRFLDRRSADAMTIGSDVYLRNDRYDLTDNRRLALLGHELTHVAQQASNDASMPNHRHLNSGYEDTALANERLIYSHLNMPSRTIHALANVHPLATAASAASQISRTQSAQPMFAATHRSLEAPDKIPPGADTALISDMEMTRLKDEIYRDLVMRLKIELERGS